MSDLRKHHFNMGRETGAMVSVTKADYTQKVIDTLFINLGVASIQTSKRQK